MDQRVIVMLPSIASSTQSGTGVTTFPIDSEDWASVKALSGSELLAASSISSEVQYEVEMRFRGDMTPRAKLEWTPFGGTAKTLEVHSVQPSSRAHAGMTLMCGVLE